MSIQKLAPKVSTTPISCIYYGDSDTLVDIIENIKMSYPQLLVAYACHKADTDDTKDHTHILIKTTANKISNVDKLRDFFKHRDIAKEGDGYYTTKFVVTKETALGDWFEYVQHNPDYLAEKGQTRNITYDASIIQGDASFIEDLHTASIIRRQNKSTLAEESDLAIIKNSIDNGLDDYEILQRLPLVTADNLNAILCGIKRLRMLQTREQIIETNLDASILYFLSKYCPTTLAKLSTFKAAAYERSGNCTTTMILAEVLEKLLSSEIDLIDFILNN